MLKYRVILITDILSKSYSGLLKKAHWLQHSLFGFSGLDKQDKTGVVEDDCNCQTPKMYQKYHDGKLSAEVTWTPEVGPG